MLRVLLLAAICSSPALAEPDPAFDAAMAYFKANPSSDRRINAVCDAESTTLPGYGDIPMQICSYSVTSRGKTLEGYVYLLNPSFENVARRVANACAFVKSANPSRCGTMLATRIIRQNGAQFPVAGIVIEKKIAAGGSGEDLVNLEFRDGVATRTEAGFYWTQEQLTRQDALISAQSKVERAMRYARIADATRADYRAGGGQTDVGEKPGDGKDQAWLDAARNNEIEARRTGNDVLLNGLAKRLKSVGQLP